MKDQALKKNNLGMRSCNCRRKSLDRTKRKKSDSAVLKGKMQNDSDMLLSDISAG